MNKIKLFIRDWLINYMRNNFDRWGVSVESVSSGTPAEFVITKHAIERMEARFHCRKDKIYKMVIKAWQSKQHIDSKFVKRKRYFHADKFENQDKVEYRFYMGYLFVFRRHDRYKNQKILITLYNSKDV